MGTALVALIVLLAIGFGVDLWTRARLVERQREDIRLRLGPYANTITVALKRRLERLNGLKEFVGSEHSVDQMSRDFPVLGAGLLKGASGVRALELIRGGTIEWVYPPKGNENLVNRHFALDSTTPSGRDLLRVAQTDSVVITGPAKLLTSGVGLVASVRLHPRAPAFPTVASVIVDVDSILAVSGLLNGAPMLDIALLDRQSAPMGSSHATMPADPVRADVIAPDGNWTLIGSPVGGWNAAVAASLLAFRAAGFAIMLLFSGLIYLILERQTSLTAAVEARTHELQIANEELGREVHVRHEAEAALRRQEEQLLHAQKMEAVGTLAGGIAHDFNNVLTAIIGFGGLALDRAKDFAGSHGESEGLSGIRQDLEEILRASQHAAVVTNQLLAFSRKQVARPEPLDVGTVVHDVEGLLQRLIGERVRLETRIATDLPNVFVDQDQLTQVLVNLVVNARDAMPEGGHVSVEAAREHVHPGSARAARGMPPGQYVEIKVEDTGHGMSPDVLSRVFEPFYTTKGLGKGTGLGLSTVYGIVGRLGGRVLVESVPGTGTIFRVLLPEYSVECVADDVVPDLSVSGERTETILLAEDEPAVRQLATRVLSRLGFTVLAAASGEDAIAVSASHAGRIHILLTDLVMPGISGRATAERLREQRPDMRVLFMSGYSEETANLDGSDGGRALLLTKPFTPAKLASFVREVLDGA